MRKTKSEGKTVEIFENFANTSQCVRNLSEFRKGLANLAMVANLAMWFAKLAKWLRIWQCGLRSWQSGLRSWQWLRISLASEISLS